MRKAQRGAAGRRGPLPWVSRGSCGLVFRIQEDAVGSGRGASRRTVKSGLAARSGQSGHGKVAQGKFQPQNCDALLSLLSPLGGGSRFRVLEDLESDDCASGAAGREEKRALRQVSASTNKRVSCCRKQDDDMVRVGEQRPGGLYADVVLRRWNCATVVKQLCWPFTGNPDMARVITEAPTNPRGSELYIYSSLAAKEKMNDWKCDGYSWRNNSSRNFPVDNTRLKKVYFSI